MPKIKVKTYKLTQKRLNEFIEKNKYLKDSKYYKNNVISVAAWDSWAAQGQGGSCSCCGSGYYNGSLENKRRSRKSGKNGWMCNEICHLCDNCLKEIQEKIGYRFLRR